LAKSGISIRSVAWINLSSSFVISIYDLGRDSRNLHEKGRVQILQGAGSGGFTPCNLVSIQGVIGKGAFTESSGIAANFGL
jgi:hypothetical protein